MANQQFIERKGKLLDMQNEREFELHNCNLLLSDDGLDNNKLPIERHGHVCGVNTSTNMTHASAATSGTTYLDYIKTTETEENVKVQEYSYKVILSGDIIELYKYEEIRYKKIIMNADLLKKEKIITFNNEQEIDKEKGKDIYSHKRDPETIRETRRRLKRSINANVNQYLPMKDKFITLTFEEMLTRDEVVKCFKLFNKRLRYKYNEYKYQYIAVIEKGTKGTKRLHLHCLFFGLPYIPVLEFREIWVYGNVDMKAIKNYNDVAGYVLKYIEKTLSDDNYIPKGKKFYISSMNLKKSKELYLDEEKIVIFLEKYKENTKTLFETDFTSLFVGKGHYTKKKIINVEVEEGGLS